jgi:hypothetical protein
MDTASVPAIPECDVHLHMFEVHRPAEFDAPLNVPGRPGAYLCAGCLPKWSMPGSPLVQRLRVGGA